MRAPPDADRDQDQVVLDESAFGGARLLTLCNPTVTAARRAYAPGDRRHVYAIELTIGDDVHRLPRASDEAAVLAEALTVPLPIVPGCRELRLGYTPRVAWEQIAVRSSTADPHRAETPDRT